MIPPVEEGLTKVSPSAAQVAIALAIVALPDVAHNVEIRRTANQTLQDALYRPTLTPEPRDQEHE